VVECDPMGQTPGRLSGRTALVTGAARRIGRLVALALAEEGADVVVHHHTSAADAAATVDEVRRLGRRAAAVSADLGAPAAVEALLSRAAEALGPVDLLVSSASVFPRSALPTLTPEALLATLQVNAFAPLFLARALAAQGLPGHVVNLLDTRVVRHDPTHFAYQTSKVLLHGLTRMLALELAPRIAVNAVAPGPALAPAGEDETYLARLAETTPLRRAGGAEEVARAVVFLATSRMITGQVLFVDGGGHLKGGLHG
jgi:pteridine reductase